MSDESPLRTDQETSGEGAEMVVQFHQQPFWRRAALLSAALLWYVSTRYLLPALAVAIIVTIAF